MKVTLTLFAALLLASLAAPRASRNLPDVPKFGRLGCEYFQALGKTGAMTSNDWN